MMRGHLFAVLVLLVSQCMAYAGQINISAPAEITLPEEVELFFTLRNTTGTVHLVVERDGAGMSRQDLGHVSSETAFYFHLSPEEAGTYTFSVLDSSGVLGSATTIVHPAPPRIVNVSLVGIDATHASFFITFNGVAVENGTATVAVNGGYPEPYEISGGMVSVPVEPVAGQNNFTVKYDDTVHNLFYTKEPPIEEKLLAPFRRLFRVWKRLFGIP